MKTKTDPRDRIIYTVDGAQKSRDLYPEIYHQLLDHLIQLDWVDCDHGHYFPHFPRNADDSHFGVVVGGTDKTSNFVRLSMADPLAVRAFPPFRFSSIIDAKRFVEMIILTNQIIDRDSDGE